MILFALFFSLFSNAGIEKRFEDGLAITHPRVLVTMESREQGLGLGYYLDKQLRHDLAPQNLHNDKIVRRPMFQVIFKSLENEFRQFKKEFHHKYNTVGVGVQHHGRLFDLNYLKDDKVRFALTGVVSRLDLAYQDPDTCGETRLIYRLAYRFPNKNVASRLPMTLNVILHAKDRNSELTCQDLAQRWQNLDFSGLTVSDAVNLIFDDREGPLAPELRTPQLLKSIELNLQLTRTAAGVRPDFGGQAIYLLKKYDWIADSRNLVEVGLRNQVNPKKAKAFFAWLFSDQERLQKLDSQTLQIPDEFLDTRSLNFTPGGLARAQNHPLGSYFRKNKESFEKKLEKMGYGQFKNIKSIEGFGRRITDTSCTGCHQSRAVGGFHFMGQDPRSWIDDGSPQGAFVSKYPGNSVVVPGSAHFFADLIRRRKILNSLAETGWAEFEAGFAEKPQGSQNAMADSSGLGSGWGSHCHLGKDPSFATWKCAAGLQCKSGITSPWAPEMGICVSNSLDQIGDPTVFGKVQSTGSKRPWNMDKFFVTDKLKNKNEDVFLYSPQSGGFPGGGIRVRGCPKSLMSTTQNLACGMLPKSSSKVPRAIKKKYGQSFNACLFKKTTTFQNCLEHFTTQAGLRKCSRRNPCRDDYICAETTVAGEEDSGACLPPYFTFGFRVDGHPLKFD